MRKVLISLAASGAALVVASPAAAQYYPAPQPYGYNGYGYNGYGYNNFGQVRALQARIDAVENQIRRLDRRDVIRDNSADRLREEADNVERRLHRAARYGLNGYEARDIEVRIARLEQRVNYAVANRYGRYGYGYNGRYGDHDRDHDWNRDDD
jgi:hypothetical protein